jgi:hypothetical protein
MYMRQFLQVLLGALALPFFACLVIGVAKGYEYSPWVGFKAGFFTFLFAIPFFIAPKWRVLRSLAKGNKL